MPRLKDRTRRDGVKGLILEYKATHNLSSAQMAELMGVSRNTYSKMINHEHSDEWLSQAKKFCKKVGIPAEDFRREILF